MPVALATKPNRSSGVIVLQAKEGGKMQLGPPVQRLE